MKIAKSSILIIFLFVFIQAQPIISRDNAPEYFNGHFKLMAYEDITGTGNFIWDRQWYVGDISIYHGKIMWNFVIISGNYYQLDFLPWEGDNYPKTTKTFIVKNIHIGKEFIIFDLVNDPLPDVIHFQLNRQSKELTGQGIRNSEISPEKGQVKVQFRPIDTLVLPGTKVR